MPTAARLEKESVPLPQGLGTTWPSPRDYQRPNCVRKKTAEHPGPRDERRGGRENKDKPGTGLPRGGVPPPEDQRKRGKGRASRGGGQRERRKGTTDAPTLYGSMDQGSMLGVPAVQWPGTERVWTRTLSPPLRFGRRGTWGRVTSIPLRHLAPPSSSGGY